MPFDKKYIFKPYKFSSRHEKYNIFTLQTVFDKKKIAAIMPKDTVYVTILREPFENFRSAFRYYNVPVTLKIKTASSSIRPIEEFLKRPKKYEKVFNYGGNVTLSFTRNLMSADLGLPKEKYDSSFLIKRSIADIDATFKLVLILEYFAESLVLLRRYLCWDFENILYIPQNVATPKRMNKLTKDRLKKLHSKWSIADYAFYNYFNKTLWTKIKQQPNDFMAEVFYLKNSILKVKKYCVNNLPTPLRFKDSRWHRGFNFPQSACTLMRTRDDEFTKILKPLYTALEL